MKELYHTVELPLCPVLARMEQRGFLVDAKALSDFGESLTGTIRQLEQRIYDAAGAPFNINSPKQLGKVLFEDLRLPHGKKTKTGWSTNADVLEKLRWQHPIVADVLEYRQYSKLKSTYADGLLKVIDADGRIRTSFQMTVTATGRLSSTEPNLQNIPTRTELGSQMRRMFVAAPGNLLVDADYSQIELRLLAHISGDEVMQQAFRSGEDFHTLTASKVFHVPPEEGDSPDALTGQGRELRHRLWHFPLLPVSGYRRHRGRGQGVYGALLRHLHRRPPVYDGGGGAGPAAGLRRHSLRAAAGAAGAEEL